jgi:acetolactate synthase small subunit
MGRLIAQTLLMPELNQVYHELLSFKGAEFYTAPLTDPKTFMETHNKAIPIYTHNDFLYVLASSKSDIESLRSTALSVYNHLEIRDQSRYHDKHIVIFGKNHKLPYILDSISLYEKENNTTIHVTLIESNDAQVIQKTTDTVEKIDHILILSADDLSPDEYDSDVLVTLLMTQELAKKHEAEIIIELLDPRHFDIAQSYNVQNTIISNEYISRLMTQLSKNRHLYDLFIDLLTYDAADASTQTYEVYAYQAKHVIRSSLPLSFANPAEAIYSFYRSGDEDYLLIGIIHDQHLQIFKGNLDEPKQIIIEPDDYLIMICK